MQRITDVCCRCACGWQGTVGDCEPDVDGDGSLGCPDCRQIINVTLARPSRRGTVETILRRLCDWRVLAVAFAVIIAADTMRSNDPRNWAWLLAAIFGVLMCLIQWDSNRRVARIERALEQLLGPDLDGAAHPEMAGTLERLRFWWQQVRQN